MRARIALVLLVAGCADPAPCDGHDGACLGIVVSGAAGLRVDQLSVRLAGAAAVDARTPGSPGAPVPLPVSTTVYLPEVAGPATVEVIGWLAGTEMGSDRARIVLIPRRHQTVSLRLGPGPADLGATADGDLPGGDLAPEPADLAPAEPSDLASADLTSADLADLARADAADLAVVDLAPAADQFLPDLKGSTVPRFMFLLPASNANLGGQSALDANCTWYANNAGMAGSFAALIATAQTSPLGHIKLGQGRSILLPSGRKVATDATLFTYMHVAAIDEVASGYRVSGCVWTGYDATGVASGAPTCASWSTNASGAAGGVGDPGSIGGWAAVGTMACNTVCFVYCIQQ